MWIELTARQGRRFAVNTDHVEAFGQDDYGAVVCYADGLDGQAPVQESYAYVLRMLGGTCAVTRDEEA